jgi:3-oxoadipate enol-lactonase
MNQLFINTRIGTIAVYKNDSSSDKAPVILLHGIAFDHHLWDDFIASINDRIVITLDMPLHGKSKSNIKPNWTLDDCADMLIDILDHFKLKKVIAIGQSWGSMTIIRAAHRFPEDFSALGLCNMPFKKPTMFEKLLTRLQHFALIRRDFFNRKFCTVMMGKETLAKNPELINKLLVPIRKLSNREISYTNVAVRIKAEDATELIKSLQVPAFALVGREDLVGLPPLEHSKIVEGGHVTPLEAPGEVKNLIEKLIIQTDSSSFRK